SRGIPALSFQRTKPEKPRRVKTKKAARRRASLRRKEAMRLERHRAPQVEEAPALTLVPEPEIGPEAAEIPTPPFIPEGVEAEPVFYISKGADEAEAATFKQLLLESQEGDSWAHLVLIVDGRKTELVEVSPAHGPGRIRIAWDYKDIDHISVEDHKIFVFIKEEQLLKNPRILPKGSSLEQRKVFFAGVTPPGVVYLNGKKHKRAGYNPHSGNLMVINEEEEGVIVSDGGPDTMTSYHWHDTEITLAPPESSLQMLTPETSADERDRILAGVHSGDIVCIDGREMGTVWGWNEHNGILDCVNDRGDFQIGHSPQLNDYCWDNVRVGILVRSDEEVEEKPEKPRTLPWGSSLDQRRAFLEDIISGTKVYVLGREYKFISYDLGMDRATLEGSDISFSVASGQSGIPADFYWGNIDLSLDSQEATEPEEETQGQAEEQAEVVPEGPQKLLYTLTKDAGSWERKPILERVEGEGAEVYIDGEKVGVVYAVSPMGGVVHFRTPEGETKKIASLGAEADYRWSQVEVGFVMSPGESIVESSKDDGRAHRLFAGRLSRDLDFPDKGRNPWIVADGKVGVLVNTYGRTGRPYLKVIWEGETREELVILDEHDVIALRRINGLKLSVAPAETSASEASDQELPAGTELLPKGSTRKRRAELLTGLKDVWVLVNGDRLFFEGYLPKEDVALTWEREDDGAVRHSYDIEPKGRGNWDNVDLVILSREKTGLPVIE
ncbi:hypothetical protein HOG48_02385, partial [Candidatus Peregrinibacteria bacterium]|nr:hypothetical protein [Candidatus Peregrinibacteria bacterium]